MTSTTRKEVGRKSLGKVSDPPLLILTCLSEGPKHGHAMQRDIERLHGKRLGPGPLYGAIQRLEKKGMIEALPSEDRRQPYQITKTGRDFLEAQLARMRRIAETVSLEMTPAKVNMGSSIPSYYEIEQPGKIKNENEQPATNAPGHSPD